MEKFLKMFKNKEKRIENLVFVLVLLIVTLLIINSVIKDDKEDKSKDGSDKKGSIISIESENLENYEKGTCYTNIELEKRLEETLVKIKGISKIKVLITYSETEEIVPIYNLNNNLSQTEEGEGKEKKIKKEESISKNVIIDENSNVLIEKKISPKIEGAIIIAKGAEDVNVKSNIILAVEAVTGLGAHKIQVFEMGDEKL